MHNLYEHVISQDNSEQSGYDYFWVLSGVVNVTVTFQHAASHWSQRLVYFPPTDASSVGGQDMFGLDAAGHCTFLE